MNKGNRDQVFPVGRPVLHFSEWKPKRIVSKGSYSPLSHVTFPCHPVCAAGGRYVYASRSEIFPLGVSGT